MALTHGARGHATTRTSLPEVSSAAAEGTGWPSPATREEMEAPQVYEIGGRCYLVFCTKVQWLSLSYRSRFPVHTFRDTNYPMVGESPLGPFRLHGTCEIMSAAPPSSWYAGQLVRCAGEWFLLSTVTDDAGRTSFSDPVPVVADETGIHVDMAL